MRSIVGTVFAGVLCSWLLARGGVKAEETSTPNNPCSLCFDGSSSPFPSQEIFKAFESPLPKKVKTCREVEEYLVSGAVDFRADSQECATFREDGALYCGCPAVPYDEESSSCSLCYGGAAPEEELLDFVLVSASKGSPEVTCRAAYALSSLPNQSGFTCDDLRWVGYKYCGCPRPSGDPICELECHIPESKWDDTTVKRAFPGLPKVELTCGDVDAFTRMTTTGEGCSVLASAANAGCGCPAPSRKFGEEFACPLCPNDDNLMPLGSTLNKKVNGPFTCFDALRQASYQTQDGDSCDASLFLAEAVQDICCNPVCKDDLDADLYVAFRNKGEVTNCAGVASYLNDTPSKRPVYCNSQGGKVEKKCQRTCSFCYSERANCADADDALTFPKMNVDFVTQVCRRLARKKTKKIAQICKDNPLVRKTCGKTCNPDSCSKEDTELSTCDIDFQFDMEPKGILAASFPQRIVDDETGQCFLRFTDDFTTNVASIAMTNFEFSSGNKDKLFSVTFGYRLYGANGGSGDGIAFVMQTGEEGEADAADTRIGDGGGFFGVYGAAANALVVELDSYWNNGFYASMLFDDSAQHVHVMTVDSAGDLTEVAEAPPRKGIRTDDNGSDSGRVWIEYCGNNRIEVFLNHSGDTKPTKPVISAFLDLNAVLSKNGGAGSENQEEKVVIGFGSANAGGGADFHEVTSMRIGESCS